MAQHRRLELKLREMESKLELEQTSKGRLETQIGRLKEVIEGLNKDNENLRVREKATNDEMRKMSKVMRDTKEELAAKQGKDTEYSHKKLDFEKQLELAEAETISVRNELKIAQRRIEDLQAAIQGDMDTSVGESDEDEEDTGDAELFLRRIVRSGSQASSGAQFSSLVTDPGSASGGDTGQDKSISTLSVNSNDTDTF